MMSLENLEIVQSLVDGLPQDDKPRKVKEIYGDLWIGSRGDKIRKGYERR